MMPLHPSFRSLVLRNIPQLDREDLDDYDGLIALRLELVHRRSHVPGPPQPGVPNPDGESPRDDSGKPKIRRKLRRPPLVVWPREGTPREKLDFLIDETTRRANAIIAPYRAQFDALHKLWSARRNLALHQGGILQIPSSWEGLKCFAGALGKYVLVQLNLTKVVWPLTRGRLKNPSFLGRWAAIAAFVSMLLYGVSTLQKGGDNVPQPPKDRDSTAVRQ